MSNYKSNDKELPVNQQTNTNEILDFIKRAVEQVKKRPEGMRGPFVYADEKKNTESQSA